ncbi:MAG: RHS repeat-associated core domain-containing protein, partial [Chloroflexi bacterium]|nr:RHS repeat-associated core domain-containing protein [Chloroflexota bacterium]
DGDGNRIKKAEGGSTIVYPTRYYEKNVTTSTATSYYYLGDRLVALKKGSTLEYMHQDHLSSSSLSSDSSGGQLSKTTFFSFGSTRSSTGTLGTDMKYTGQRLDGTDLYFYNARYYDAGIGRFISPDSVTPNFADPQGLNRYSYVRNDPLRYVDPTGHYFTDEDGNPLFQPNSDTSEPEQDDPEEDAGEVSPLEIFPLILTTLDAIVPAAAGIATGVILFTAAGAVSTTGAGIAVAVIVIVPAAVVTIIGGGCVTVILFQKEVIPEWKDFFRRMQHR